MTQPQSVLAMIFKLLCISLFLLFFAFGCGEGKKTAAQIEVECLEETVIEDIQPYLGKVELLVRFVVEDYEYEKVLLSASSTPRLTVLRRNGVGEAVKVLGEGKFRKDDGQLLDSAKSVEFEKLMKFLRDEKLYGFIYSEARRPVMLYIKPNLRLLYFGDEVDSSIFSSYLRDAERKYDPRGDFYIQINEKVFVSSVRR